MLEQTSHDCNTKGVFAFENSPKTKINRILLSQMMVGLSDLTGMV